MKDWLVLIKNVIKGIIIPPFYSSFASTVDYRNAMMFYRVNILLITIIVILILK